MITKDNKYEYGLDISKIVAGLFVPMIHHFRFAGFYNQKLNSPSMFLFTMEFGVLMSCVPIFLIVTGFVLRNREVNKSHYHKLIDFILLVIPLHLIGILVKCLNLQQSFEMIDIMKMIFDVPYFVTMYIQIYCLAPFINTMYKSLDDNQKKILLIVVIFIFSVPQLINRSFFNILYTGWQSAYAFMYYIFGLYIADKDLKISFSKGIFLLLLVNFIYASLIFVMAGGKGFTHSLGHYNGLFTACNAVLIIMICRNITIKSSTLMKVVPIAASTTIGNYLVGANGIESVLNRWFLFDTFKMNMLFNPVKSIVSFMISGLITYFVVNIVKNRKKIMKLQSK